MRRRILVALLAVLVTAPVTRLDAHASTPDAAVAAGVCAVAGTATETFSPAVHAQPATVKVVLDGSGTCAGLPVTNTISFTLAADALLSCVAGEGTLAGNVSFTSGFPPPSVLTGLYIGTPGSEVVELTGQGLTVAGVLAWSPVSTATCAVSGTVSTPLYGSLVYAFE